MDPSAGGANTTRSTWKHHQQAPHEVSGKQRAGQGGWGRAVRTEVGVGRLPSGLMGCGSGMPCQGRQSASGLPHTALNTALSFSLSACNSHTSKQTGTADEAGWPDGWYHAVSVCVRLTHRHFDLPAPEPLHQGEVLVGKTDARPEATHTLAHTLA